MKNWSIEDKLLVVLVVIAAAFRFYNFDQWSLSNDELSALARLKFDTFGEMVEKGVKDNDMHPMGVQAFLWVWTHLFGIEETMLRLPFVLFGIGSVVLVYLTGRNMFGKASALAATTVFTALQFPVLYAQLARPYSPGLFFALLISYAWSHMCFVRKKWNWPDAMLFVAGGCGAMYSHYFSFMFAGLVSLTGYWLLPRRDLIKYSLCGVVMMVLYVPNLSVFLAQFSVGGLGGPEGWLGPPEKDAVWNYILYCYNESLMLFMFSVIMVGWFAWMYRQSEGLKTKRIIALSLFMAPALVAYFYSILKNPVFQYSILLFSFPFLLLFMFSWFRPQQWKTIQYVQLLLLLIVPSYSTVVARGFYNRQFFAPFKDVADKVVEYNRLFGKDGVLNSVNVINRDYIHYYSDRMMPQLHFEQYACFKPEHIHALLEISAASKANTLVQAWCNHYHAPELEWAIREQFPYLIASDTFFNAGVMVFSRLKNKNEVEVPKASYNLFVDFEGQPWENDSVFKSTEKAASGRFSMLMKPDQEYGPTVHIKAGDIGLQKEATVMFSCKVNADSALADIKMVFQVKRGEEFILWRGFDLRPYQRHWGEWFSSFGGYKIQETVLPDDDVSIYFNNPSKEKVYLDDVHLVVR